MQLSKVNSLSLRAVSKSMHCCPWLQFQVHQVFRIMKGMIVMTVSTESYEMMMIALISD